MATRSRIALERENGTVVSIYCHNDGYLNGVGSTLATHYTDPKKVQSLISLGDLSSIGAKLEPPAGEKHSFDNPIRGVTIAYRRDRGEGGCLPRHDKTVDDYFNSDTEEYGYLLTKEGVWKYVTYSNKNPVTLTENTSE